MRAVEGIEQTLGDMPVQVFWIHAGRSAEISLTRVKPARDTSHTTPVLLVHGNFSHRGFWISPKGIGLGPFLSQQGYDAWIVELRGHGLSPKGKGFRRITAEDHIKHDLPAAVDHIVQSTGKPLFLVGHSAGGIFIAASLSAGWLDLDRILGIALFGTQLAYGERFIKIPPLAWLSSCLLRLLGRIPASRLGLGPEDEPAGEFLEFISWKKWKGQWENKDGFSYWDGLSKVSTPVLGVAAARDKNDPPEGCEQFLEAFGSEDREFILLAKSRGFSKDYDHVGMVVSKEAAQEVWPLLASWMDRHR